MSTVKRMKDEFDERMAQVGDIISSIDNEDNDTDDTIERRAYAAVFAAWRDGDVAGTAEEVFEAVSTYLDPTYMPD